MKCIMQRRKRRGRQGRDGRYVVRLTPHEAHAICVAVDLYADEFCEAEGPDDHGFGEREQTILHSAHAQVVAISSDYIDGPNVPSEGEDDRG